MSSTGIYKGILIGAAAGTALALLDKQTRNKVNSQFKSMGGSLQYYKGHPSEAIRDFREYYDRLAEDLSKKTEDTLDILSQIQETVDKVNSITQKNKSESTKSISPSKTVD